MADPANFQRAKLEIEGEEPLECWFNPKEYAISKSNDWTAKPFTGAGLPTAQFGGGHARELTLDLMFDAVDTGADVRGVTDRLFKMMEVDSHLGGGSAGKNKGRPPAVTFSWGRIVSFQAVAKSLNVQYLLFDPEGTPLRAQAKVSLMQVHPADSRTGKSKPPPQNPTSRATEGRRAHVVRDGDSLPSIAYGAYGDATRWRVVAEANGIDDPLRLRRGASLAIPDLDG